MTPSSVVTLYATPFDISNKYVIKANSEGEALAIVGAFPSRVYTDCYWMRDNDFVFRANGNINEVEQYNYAVFLNNGKYNFAFITQCTYVNDAMTWVHLQLDPWLNFAGKYTFHPSPMVRCHPPNDTEKNFCVEPYSVDAWNLIHKDLVNPGASPTYKIFLMTVLDPDNYYNLQYSTWLQGMLDIFNGNGITQMQNYFNAITQMGGTQIMNIHPQASTCLCTKNTLGDRLQAIIRAGCEGDILGAYYVPTELLTANQRADGFYQTINPMHTTLNLSLPPISNYHWRKQGYSEQFNRLYVNLAGSVYYFPFNQLKADTTDLELQIGVDPSANGCIYAWLDETQLTGAPGYMFHSKSWDTVQISGYGINQYAASGWLGQFGNATYNTLKKTISDITPMSLLTHPISTLGGAALDLVAGAAGMVYNQGRDAIEILKEGGYAGGTTVSSMAAYNLNFPLIMFCYESPVNDNRIDEMFGTYGYTQDGRIQPITFGNLPHWNYYQTQEALIEGRQVPQRFLDQIIARFNAGIFVFNTAADYKNITQATAQSNHY